MLWSGGALSYMPCSKVYAVVQITSIAPWPSISHRHERGIGNASAGAATVFDTANMRYSLPGNSTGRKLGAGSSNIELFPAAGSLNAIQVLNIQAPQNCVAWRIPSVYQVRIT